MASTTIIIGVSFERVKPDTASRDDRIVDIFYTTEDFSEYHIAIISNRDIIEAKFLPLSPAALANHLLIKLLDYPLIEAQGFGACRGEIKNYSRELSMRIKMSIFLIFLGIGTILACSLIYFSQPIYFVLNPSSDTINNGVYIYIMGLAFILIGIYGKNHISKQGIDIVEKKLK